MKPLRRRRSPMALAVAAMIILSVARPAPADGPKEKSTRTTGAKLDYVDSLLKESWESASVKPSRVATDEEYLRRAYLDLLGRIPNIREAGDFLRSKEAGKRAKLVEYLLAHPDYPKNFATQWKVILLGRKGQPREVNAASLTNWLRRQFAENRPWNEFAYDLLTAKGSNKDNGPVNYTLAHMMDEAVNLTSLTTRVFLGQQIQCTQCHDHPSNDWKQADFWGINAFYKGVKREEVRTANAAGTETVDHYELSDEPTEKWSRYEQRDARIKTVPPTFLDGRKLGPDKDVDRREALGKFITEPANQAFAQAFVNRMWGHFFGRGFVQPVDDFGSHNPASHPELLARLGDEFKASGYDIKALVRWIMNSDAYNLTSASLKENEKDETLFSHMNLKPMTPEQLFDSLIVATAAHKAGGEDNSRRRDMWLNQFLFTFANDEGEESLNFQGTIPQALMMMNGELIDQATAGKAGSFLADLLDRAQLQGKVSADAFIVNQLYLAALSRSPSRNELAKARSYFENHGDPKGVIADMFWALLNSNEFVLNR